MYSSLNNSGRLVVWELSTDPLSVTELEDQTKDVSIYPNPASTEINFQFNDTPLYAYSISIINTMGTNVYTEQIKTPEHNHKLVLNLPGGVYFATIFRNGKTVTKKIVITKNGDY